jgi:hypothetical protein
MVVNCVDIGTGISITSVIGDLSIATYRHEEPWLEFPGFVLEQFPSYSGVRHAPGMIRIALSLINGILRLVNEVRLVLV